MHPFINAPLLMPVLPCAPPARPQAVIAANFNWLAAHAQAQSIPTRALRTAVTSANISYRDVATALKAMASALKLSTNLGEPQASVIKASYGMARCTRTVRTSGSRRML